MSLFLISLILFIFLGVVFLEIQKSSRKGKLKGLGAKVDCRSYFYDEFSIYKMGSPYRIVFKDVRIDGLLCDEIKSILLKGWFPVELEFRNCPIEVDLSEVFKDCGVGRVSVYNIPNRGSHEPVVVFP